MSRVKLCYKELCNRRVYAVGLCAVHYEVMVFGGESKVLAELESMCANPVCASPVKQKRDELGNVLNRNLYCTRCRNIQNRDGNGWVPVDDWFNEDCKGCGAIIGRAELCRFNGKCSECRELSKRESYKRQLEYQKERRRRKVGR